ncbi:MAG: NAD(P)-dependent oxidoreductase [Candidatus Saccharimonas sp.]|nr:MAG: NAD(P)-dependent oxidoreductase [Candidatus Saccharimonas sp.]
MTIRGAKVLRDYVHIDDVVHSIICAVNASGVGVVNIGTGRGVSIRETAQAIVDSMQSPSRIAVLSEDGGSDIVIDISRAEKLLDYHPEVFFPDKIKEMEELYE